jgi:hypothetical protein
MSHEVVASEEEQAGLRLFVQGTQQTNLTTVKPRESHLNPYVGSFMLLPGGRSSYSAASRSLSAVPLLPLDTVDRGTAADE